MFALDAVSRQTTATYAHVGTTLFDLAVNPANGDVVCIELNPRVSRSSALASKATGYPIAKIAAKLAIGYSLDELKNQITKTTSAYFEPSLDYVIVKMPRWNFEKFHGANDLLGLQMKSVGEVMAIGRNFLEALQKACQSQEEGRMGLGADKKEWIRTEDILERLQHASADRVYRIKDALRLGEGCRRHGLDAGRVITDLVAVRG